MNISSEDEKRAQRGAELRKKDELWVREQADPQIQPNFYRRVAAEQELTRREREEWAARFEAQESARVKAQKFQEAQTTRQIEANEKLMGQQLDVANEHADAAKHAAQAARMAAWATVSLVIVTAILAAIQLFTD